MLRGPVLLPGILHGPDPPLLLHRPDLSLFRGADLSLFLHRLDLCPGILHALGSNVLCRLRLLHGLRFGISFRLHGHGLCPGIFLGGPALKFTQQALGRGLIDFSLALIGSSDGGINFIARRRLTRSRLQSLSAGR
jgi:hypothetical protein